MATAIVNAAPMTNLLGVQDNSIRAVPSVPENLPTHLPKVYTFAQKGPTDPQLLVGASLTNMYGAGSFDVRGAFATHQTNLINLVNATGNAMMVQRLQPADAAPPANFRLSLDVLPTKVPEYTRGTDGMIELDTNGNPIATGSTISGYKVKFVTEYIAPDGTGASTFGLGAQSVGDQTDSTTNTQSTRYPILDMQVPSFGSEGNLHGFRLYAATQLSSPAIDVRILEQEKVYPFRMQFLVRPDVNQTPAIVSSQSGAQYEDLCFKPGVIDQNTDSLLFIGDRLIQDWQSLNNTDGSPNQYGPFGQMFLYQENLDTLLTEFLAAETPYIDSFSDFVAGDTNQEYRFNFISGVSSQNVPYHSYIINTEDANAVRLTSNSTIFATGGTDGTMGEANFATLVSAAVAEYADPNSPLQDMAYYPESIMYDTGFPLQTKYDLCQFVSLRKDTVVVLSTYDVLGTQLNAAQESALAVALRTRLQMYPESDYYGTPVLRGVIIGRNGTLLNSQYTKKLPLTIEFAVKCAKYMGAGNGIWKEEFAFDQDQLNQVTMFKDVNVTFTPASVRNSDWDNGLVWVENYSRRALYWPAFKTVYDNDTSILTSFFNMMICVECEKVGNRVRQMFSGNSKLTNAQLIDRVNRATTEQTSNRFDNRVTIIPNTYFTTADTARGYSWTNVIQVYGPNMKTVGTITVQANRIEDLQTTSSQLTTTS